jgi:hypothetical protein
MKESLGGMWRRVYPAIYPIISMHDGGIMLPLHAFSSAGRICTLLFEILGALFGSALISSSTNIKGKTIYKIA